MDNSVVVDDYQQIDRILKEERKYILNLLKPIIKSGCNVLLIQKSILRDAVNDLSLHYLVCVCYVMSCRVISCCALMSF